MINEVHIASISCLKKSFTFHVLLKLGYLWRLQLPLLSSRDVSATICLMCYEAWRCPPWFSALSRFSHYISITSVKEVCAITLYHSLGFLVQSSATSPSLPSFIKNFGYWFTVFLYRRLLASFLTISRLTEVIHPMLVSVFDHIISQLVLSLISDTNPMVIH